MAAEETSLEARYRRALLAHVHQEAEQALMDGLELGRITLTMDMGCLTYCPFITQ
jgi:hypothetical protein